ncbi:MAG: class II aldolase/adducin family protein [Opitutales bacterium]|nr:class II aldolase/adducin family protein [Opitutales bacterium]
MPTIITEKDLLEMQKKGESLDTLPAGALLTPSAKDLLSSLGKAPTGAPARPGSSAKPKNGDTYQVPPLPDFEYRWKKGGDPVGNKAIQAFFHSPEIVTLKNRMVDIGRRMWNRNFVDGNGGNITIRVGDNMVLCTPTLISKGYMTPDDICLVDLDGKQLAGTRPRTSEVNTHIAIMKATPEAKSCIHGHPPHSTAYAVASVTPPSCLCSEAEVFLGEIGMVPYETPGSSEVAERVAKIAPDHCSILLENHGVIVWGKDVEDAYWKIENTETACQTIWIASQLNGGQLHSIGGRKMQDIIAIRKQLGMSDKRDGLKECELCDNSEFRPGVTCEVRGPEEAATGDIPPDERDPEAEKVVQMVTDTIMQRLKNA